MMISWGAAGLGKQVLGSAFGLALGVCQLPDDGVAYIRSMSGTACVRARASEDVGVAPGSGEGAVKVVAGSGSIGIHFSPFLSIQAQGNVRGTSRFNGAETGWSLLPEGITRQFDHLVLRIGNPALHSFRATLGDQRLPFGIDANPADDLWLVAEERIYWGSLTRGAVLTFDNLIDAELDVGLSTEDLEESSPPRLSARLMYDLSFFERARLVMSIAEDSGVRRYGFGFISTSRSGDVTQFEVVRLNAPDQVLDSGFRRLFRFAVDAADRSWWFVYDEDRLRTQSVLAGYRYFLPSNIIGNSNSFALRFSLGRVRSLNPVIKSRFIASVGVEANL